LASADSSSVQLIATHVVAVTLLIGFPASFAMPINRSRKLPQEPPTADVQRKLPAFDYDAWNEVLRAQHFFYRVDLDGKIIEASPSVQKYMGYAPRELVGRDYREVFDIDHPMRQKYLEITTAFSSQEADDLKRTVGRRADGRIAFLWSRQRDIVLDGVVFAREFMSYEATARVDTMLMLRQSERKYRRLVEGFTEDYIIYSRDAKGMITYSSPSAKKVLGYEPNELIGMYARELFVDAMLGGQVVDNFASTTERGKTLQNLRVEIKHRDGNVRILELNERPVLDVDGKLTSVEGICKDVTDEVAADRRIRDLKEDLERRVALRTEELQRMYEDLRESESRYRDVVETLNDFIVRWKPDGTRTFVNEAFARFHSLTPADLIGTSFVPTIHADDAAVFKRAMASISRENPSITYEMRVLRRDGSYPWVQWNTRAKFNEQGEVDQLQSVGRDVTQLKEAADVLRQKEAHLAHLSRLATMGEMVAGIAHEINQPLHAAKTFAEAARRNLQGGGNNKIEKAIECTGEIAQAINRTVGIIRRLRDFTRSQPFELEELSLNDVVQEAIELAAYGIRRFGVLLRLELDKDLRTTLGDRIQLEQLVVNLVMNGCEAMEQTPAEERVLTVATRAEKQRQVIVVKDAGVGVSEADMCRLFEAFYTTKPEGMGMGLVLCKSIAEAHGGELRADRNADGPGMTFTAILPNSGGKS
jgi:PAS domain S-box-containing protein